MSYEPVDSAETPVPGSPFAALEARAEEEFWEDDWDDEDDWEEEEDDWDDDEWDDLEELDDDWGSGDED